MNAFGPDLEQVKRLALALALALGLHLLLLLGFSGQGWSLRFAQPPRFTVALLPPMKTAPVPIPPDPVAKPVEPNDRPEAPATSAAPETTSPPSQPAPAQPPSSASIPVPPSAVDPPLAPATVRPLPPKAAPTPLAKAVIPPKPVRPSKVAKLAPTPPKPARPVPAANDAPVPPKPPKPPKPSLARLRRLPEKPDQPEPTRVEAVVQRPERASPSSDPVERPETRSRPAPLGVEASSGDGKRGKRSSGRLDSASLLGQIASLDAETQRQVSRAAREQRVSLADAGSLAGFYAADWARKVSRVGEMNFPDAARRLDLSLGPLLEVAIRANGSLREVRVLRSSGNPELDQAARRIVQLAAPYPAFSAALRQQAEVLRITAPWRFDPGGRVRVR